MNIDQTFLINKINQLSERVALLERKIQQYEGNNLQNNNFFNSNFSQNNILQENFINKKEEENKIYDPLDIDYTVKKNDNINKKNVLNTKKVVEIQDKIYDPLSN
jgi:hypothetical protein